MAESKEPSIRPADASVFKKPKDERKYNALVKSQSSADNLMNPDIQEYPKQTLEMIKGCLNIADKNLKDPVTLTYLVKTYGEEQGNQILQDKELLQGQRVEDYNRINKQEAAGVIPKEEADSK